jgi:predicted MFS family arabinose efflux permease
VAQSAPVSERELSFARLISTSITARIIVDTGVQLFNPFLPLIAAGLGTSVVVMGRLVSLRSAMGLFSPVFGAAADRYGYRIVLRIGLLLSAAGMLAVGVSASIWPAAIGMVVAGLGMAAFVPTLHAYLSARLPYSRRGRGLGMLEYSWALTGIFGLYLMGQLISAAGWRAPFFVLSAGLLIMAVVFGALPAARDPGSRPHTDRAAASSVSLSARALNFLRLGDNALSAYAAIGVSSFTHFAAVQLMIVYGAWFSAEYGLTATQLGTVALIFGVFDLIASVSVSLFSDRIGKRRSVFIGSVGALAGYLLLPWLNTGATIAILGVAVTRGLFEFSIVSCIPLLSEQVPTQRAKVMTLSSAISLGAVTLANFIAPALYAGYGIAVVAFTSAVAAAAGLALLLLFVREPES